MRFVLETDCRELCPEILRVDPWRKPETERFVPEAFKKLTVVPDTTVAKRLTPVAFVKEKFSVLRLVLDAVVAKELTLVALVNDAFTPFTVVPDTVLAKSEVPVAFIKLIFCTPVWPVTFNVPETFEFPVELKVAT